MSKKSIWSICSSRKWTWQKYA